MRSWVFRNRRQLERIYGRRLAGSALRAVPGPEAVAGAAAEAADGGDLAVLVLFPHRTPLLPAA